MGISVSSNPRLPVYSAADAATRAALTSMLTGDLCYQVDTKVWYYYNGAAWAAVANTDVGDGYITISPINYNSVGQGTWALQLSALHMNCCNFNNSATSATGDNLTYKVYLSAGTYTLQMIAYKGAACGIVKFDIGGAALTTFDTYFAGNQENQVFTQTGISVTSSGLYTLTMKSNTKNGASGGYSMYPNSIALWRTA